MWFWVAALCLGTWTLIRDMSCRHSREELFGSPNATKEVPELDINRATIGQTMNEASILHPRLTKTRRSYSIDSRMAVSEHIFTNPKSYASLVVGASKNIWLRSVI